MEGGGCGICVWEWKGRGKERVVVGNEWRGGEEGGRGGVLSCRSVGWGGGGGGGSWRVGGGRGARRRVERGEKWWGGGREEC